MKVETVDQFLKSMTNWASAQSDILALVLVGSYARNQARDDSDVDLVLIVTNPEHYLDQTDWIQQFGKVKKIQFEDYGPVTSIRAWYSDGIEVEYGITNERWIADPLDAGTRRVLGDGARVLLERGPVVSRWL